jgi:hypothetical protein
LRSRKAENIGEHAAHSNACEQQRVIGLANKNDIHLTNQLEEDVGANWRKGGLGHLLESLGQRVGVTLLLKVVIG